MDVTEVRIRLVQESEQEKLRAFATITFDDCFVVREVKVIEGDQGFFVAMPSRKAMERCRQCGGRNVVQAQYCNQCGRELPRRPPPTTREGREKIYLDVAHPINSKCRKMVHDAVMEAYRQEKQEEDQQARGLSDAERGGSRGGADKSAAEAAGESDTYDDDEWDEEEWSEEEEESAGAERADEAEQAASRQSGGRADGEGSDDGFSQGIFA
jgi:stage V sporulation protein G